MRTVPPWTEQWQHFMSEAAEQFWGDLYQRTRGAWQRVLEAVSRQEQERYLGLAAYERAAARRRVTQVVSPPLRKCRPGSG